MFRRKVLGFIRLFRLELPFAAGVTVLMGEMVALGGLPSVREALLVSPAPFYSPLPR
jgi:geranylgeranylglycerol-phosphate geranylgeranyltransferase